MTSDEKKQELHTLIEALLPLGEDPQEMQFWETLFDELSEAEQEEILANLRAELKMLAKN